MHTLYDVLGLARGATQAQIEAAYRLALDELSTPSTAGASDQQIRAKAIGEAYGVLSSPKRREAYDARLMAKETGPVTIIVEAPRKLPWLLIFGVLVVCAASFTWYKVQSQRTDAARVAFEAMRATAAASEAARLADIEESRLASQVMAERSRADAQRAREAAAARNESRTIHYEQEVAAISEERRREMAAARVKAEQRQDEILAQQRANQQIYNMQRALAIPVVRH